MQIPDKIQIICTIGPATWNADILRQMRDSGMTVARVNGAFADTAELDKVTDFINQIGGGVELMMDVKGPEVRLNEFPEPIGVQPGQEIIIGSNPEAMLYPANYQSVYQSLNPGQRIVIGDGDVELKVNRIENGTMFCEVVYGNLLKPGKAMNLPGANYASVTITATDITNLKHAISRGWQQVSASFIQNAQAARLIREQVGNYPMKLIAKIEDQQGIDNIQSILPEVDGIMIARGGLGVELGLEKVPMAQRYLIEQAHAFNKPVITATQMLESMVQNPRPTRAEVNDAVTAVLLGSDALMLSAESSVGKYPVEAVQWLTKCINESQRWYGRERLAI